MSSSRWGRAATIPPVTGAKPRLPRCGLTQTTRCASRDEPVHLLTEQAASPRSQPSLAIDHDRAPGHAALAPDVEEGPQRVAEAGAAAPVRDGVAGGAQRQAGVAQPQLPGHPGEPGAEGEHLGRGGRRADGRMAEAQQRVGVGRHRPAHVEQQDEPARLLPAPGPAQRAGLAAVLEQLPDGAPHVHPVGAARAAAQRAAGADPRGEQRDQSVHLLAFLAGQLGEVAVAQDLGLARGGAQHVVVGLVLAGAGVARARARRPG